MFPNVLKKILFCCRLAGVDPYLWLLSLRGLPRFLGDYYRLRRLQGPRPDFPVARLYPCVVDRFVAGGMMKGYYFHQDLHVAKLIHQNDPLRHVDVGSRMDGFVAHVASFRDIEVFDIRPVASQVENIRFTQADLMASDWSLSEYCDSLSCLHALEHFGLGRYGDPVDPEGHLKGFRNLTRTLCRGGKLYLSVPIGRQRIEFNAHRVFSVNYLLELFAPCYRVDSFSYVDDGGDLHENVPLAQGVHESCTLRFGCGIFELTKL